MAKIQAVGVDIDGRLIKIAIASLTGSRVLIDSLYTAQINAEIPLEISSAFGRKAGSGDKRDAYRKPIRANQDTFWAEVSDLIEEHLQQVDNKSNYAAAAIPQMNTVSREITFPASMTDSEIDKNLAVKVKPLLREPLSEMFYDYSISRDTNNDKVVNIIATNKSFVQPMLTALEYGGLNPLVLDIEGRMQYQYFHSAMGSVTNGDDSTVLFLDVKQTSVNIYIFEDGDMAFFKEIPLLLPEDLELLCYQAITLDKLQALAGEIEENDMLAAKTNQYIETLVASVESEMRLYQALHNGERPSKCFVYGTGTIVPKMISELSAGLKLQIKVNDILASISTGRMLKKQTYEKAGGYFATAIHLARRACHGARYV